MDFILAVFTQDHLWYYAHKLIKIIMSTAMINMTSPHDVRYAARWARGSLEIFHDGKSVGKNRISTLKKAKKIFGIVVQTKTPLQDVVDFDHASQDMIGVDLSKMSYSIDRRQILYQGEFFAHAKSTNYKISSKPYLSS